MAAQTPPFSPGSGWGTHTPPIQLPPDSPGNGWGTHTPPIQLPPDSPGNGWAVARQSAQSPPPNVGSGWTAATFYISSISPDNGPISAGTSITITGLGFTDAEGVTFSGLPGFPTTADATSFLVLNDTTITCVTPVSVASAITANLTVYKPDTPSGYLYTPLTELATFRFVAPFTVTGRTPSAGPPEGGQTVTITGTGFTGINLATAVTIGGVVHSVVGTPTDTQLQVVTQAHAAGSVNIEVTYGATTLLVGAYLYVPAATVISIENSTEPGNAARSPIAGSGSTRVITITGTGFTNTSYIKFHPIGSASYVGPQVNDFIEVDDSTLTLRAPVGFASIDIEVLVVAQNGLIALPATSGANNWRFYAPLTVTDCNPDFGTEAGGKSVIITGTGFYGTTSVEFGGTAVASFTVVSDVRIDTVTPPHAGGQVQIGVETDIE